MATPQSPIPALTASLFGALQRKVRHGCALLNQDIRHHSGERDNSTRSRSPEVADIVQVNQANSLVANARHSQSSHATEYSVCLKGDKGACSGPHPSQTELYSEITTPGPRASRLECWIESPTATDPLAAARGEMQVVAALCAYRGGRGIDSHALIVYWEDAIEPVVCRLCS